MRAFFSSAMAALVMMALFSGNCFSCPQVLLSLYEHQPAHQCCHKTHQSAASCQLQTLQHFVKADIGVHSPAVAVIAQIAVPAVSVPQTAAIVPVAEYSPPDLLSLHATLRI